SIRRQGTPWRWASTGPCGTTQTTARSQSPAHARTCTPGTRMVVSTPGSAVAWRTPGRTRTDTEELLRLLPLPLGYGGWLEISLARVDRVRTRGPVEEEQALAVVDLVLQGAGLERLRLDGHLLAR